MHLCKKVKSKALNWSLIIKKAKKKKKKKEKKKKEENNFGILKKISKIICI